jgi:hypothetical protein
MTTKTLREKLFAELERQSDPRVLGEGNRFDEYLGTKLLPQSKKKNP